jgi:glutathione S-transferase
LFGEFSVADIYLFQCLGLANRLMQATYDWDILAEVDGMSEWFELVKSREITQRVMADQAQAMQAMMDRRG